MPGSKNIIKTRFGNFKYDKARYENDNVYRNNILYAFALISQK